MSNVNPPPPPSGRWVYERSPNLGGEPLGLIPRQNLARVVKLSSETCPETELMIPKRDVSRRATRIFPRSRSTGGGARGHWDLFPGRGPVAKAL